MLFFVANTNATNRDFLGAREAVAAKGGKELFNFGGSAGRHMAEPGRAVPVQILEQAIKGSKGGRRP
ncbi:hypothetical protein SAMN05192529_1494 [Arachidicoccus rhizosphaerae]|uniref:Uncharacterized protein n=1 Tax=Arachidicoccus rhizosphaerae TaxID=551991 RepID=A0A1H4D7S0_9BACT|nr:hypothetical protein SAMN05192529_1494 [Arachidicoccus rhizosphaerae]